jgi:hypothetical protein
MRNHFKFIKRWLNTDSNKFKSKWLGLSFAKNKESNFYLTNIKAHDEI